MRRKGRCTTYTTDLQYAAVDQGTGCDLEQPPIAFLSMASEFHEAANPEACIQAGEGHIRYERKGTEVQTPKHDFLTLLQCCSWV